MGVYLKMSFHLKPDLAVTKKIIDRDFHLMFILLISVIALAVYAFTQDWDSKFVFLVMVVVALFFMGSKKDLPNDSWTPQQKGAWTKRYTTLKLNKDNIVYISSDKPNDKETFDLKDLKNITSQKNKIVMEFKDLPHRKISTKYWAPKDVSNFVSNVTNEINRT